AGGDRHPGPRSVERAQEQTSVKDPDDPLDFAGAQHEQEEDQSHQEVEEEREVAAAVTADPETAGEQQRAGAERLQGRRAASRQGEDQDRCDDVEERQHEEEPAHPPEQAVWRQQAAKLLEHSRHYPRLRGGQTAGDLKRKIWRTGDVCVRSGEGAMGPGLASKNDVMHNNAASEHFYAAQTALACSLRGLNGRTVANRAESEAELRAFAD